MPRPLRLRPPIRKPLVPAMSDFHESDLTRAYRKLDRAVVDLTLGPVSVDADCEHEWMEFGGPGDEWHECFLCGLQEDR